jgi:hypothetical protein
LIYVEPEKQRETTDCIGIICAQFDSEPTQRTNANKPNLPTIIPKPATHPGSIPTIDISSLPISEQQRQELSATAKSHNWTVVAIRAYLKGCGYANSREILNKDFASIVDGFGQSDIAEYYHEKTDIPANQSLPLGDWEASA